MTCTPALVLCHPGDATCEPLFYLLSAPVIWVQGRDKMSSSHGGPQTAR